MLVDSERVCRQITTRADRSHNHDYFRLPVTIYINEHGFLYHSVTSTDKPTDEKRCFIFGRRGLIKSNTETTDGSSLEFSLGNDDCLTRRKA